VNKSASQHPHAWPSFFIVGAPKAGTTSLFRYLGQHPDIFTPAIKEPHYFCPELARELQIERIADQSKYLSLFAAAGNTQLAGEASTSYLRASEAPQRIRQQVPEARIIILLREPGERAFSHYLMRWRAGGFRLSFAEGLARYRQDEHECRLFRQLVIEPGMYSAQIARYLDVFGHDRVKILLAEELLAEPAKTVEQTLTFLGITGAVPLTHFTTHNDYRAPRTPLSLWLLRQKHHLRFLKPWIPAQLKWRIVNRFFNRRADKPRMSEEERVMLNNIYDADIKSLRHIIGRPDLWTGHPSGRQPEHTPATGPSLKNHKK